MRRALIASIVSSFALVGSAAAHQSSMNVSIHSERDVTGCSDLRITFDSRPAEVSEDMFTLPGGEPLKVSLPVNAGIHVIGGDGRDFSVTACKAARRREDLDGVRVSPEGSSIAFRGPSSDDWVVHLIVRAPRSAALDLEARNGPIGVKGMTGRIAARTSNGPISLRDCSGTIDAHAQNGPISLDGCDGSGEARAVNGPIDFTGDGGTYRLDTQNGPISVELAGDRWSKGSLEARAVNGPLDLKLSETYRSGVVVESTGHSPVSCPSSICRAARRTFDDDGRRIEFGDSDPVIRLSTRNGPVSVKGAD
jgi:hypothetical protein